MVRLREQKAYGNLMACTYGQSIEDEFSGIVDHDYDDEDDLSADFNAVCNRFKFKGPAQTYDGQTFWTC